MVYNNTGLWNKFDLGTDATDRLKVAYLNFRKKAQQLTSLIPKTLSDLTVHDVSHLDGLWRTASLLVGDNYPMNPLELFVFGGAVLLHDSALSTEAFDGIGKLRDTLIWKDAYVLAGDRGETDQTQLEKYADFFAVRYLHAKQAEILATKIWTIPTTKEQFSLIEDESLRHSYGSLIGQIASSHNLNLDDLADYLPPQVGAIDGFPAEWSIDPIKIACVLRCADALHIDKSRAPDFLHALTKRTGVSLSHWQAQNWLSQVTKLASDASRETAVITSTKAFDPDNDKAWWVAYELISIAQNEIAGCNDFLCNNSQQNRCEFELKKIAGANSPSELNNYIRTVGWKPTQAALKVGDVKALVEKLGGQNLYATADFNSQLIVTLRELIQNAKDAVSARALLDPEAIQEISIRIEESENFYNLFVEDTGCGMSKRVLLGALLDFGSSFWASDLVNQEFPGLKTHGFKSSGKFGIGFYSVFMIADNVSVTSRRFTDAIASSVELRFKDGLSLRPMTIECPDFKSTKFTTQVKLEIKKGRNDIEFKCQFGPNYFGKESPTIEIWDAIEHLACFVGIKISFEWVGKIKKTLMTEFSNQLSDAGSWLKVVSGDRFVPSLNDNQYSVLSQNLRLIDSDDRSLGFAALSPFPELGNGRGGMTIGGLRSNLNGGDSSYFGFIDHNPDSAKRNAALRRATKDQIRSWAENQLRLLKVDQLDKVSLHVLSSRLAAFFIDPTKYVTIPILVAADQLEFFRINEVLEVIEQKELFVAVEKEWDFIAEERDLVGLDKFPRISASGAWRLFSHEQSHSKVAAPKLEDDFSIKGIIEKELTRFSLNLVIEDSFANGLTSRFGTQIKIRKLSTVAKSCLAL